MHLGSFFFFLMIGRPPRSPFFPSTTFFRPRRAHRGACPATTALRRRRAGRDVSQRAGVRELHAQPAFAGRSEEHTSELQSRQYLVCRLLLEKKKTSTKIRALIHCPSNTPCI